MVATPCTTDPASIAPNKTAKPDSRMKGPPIRPRTDMAPSTAISLSGRTAKYQIKDTGAARALAEALGLDLPLLRLADQLFTDLVAHGGGALDHSALILEMERKKRS